MLEQRRADPYAASSAFADGKTMRPLPRGVVARDDQSDSARPAITHALLTTGRTHFETLCATCHGIAGDGQSVVATKMLSRPPPSLHERRYRDLSPEQLFAIITQGYGLMPSYADLLRVDERWAVIAYVQALQLSQDAPVASLPLNVREALAKEAP